MLKNTLLFASVAQLALGTAFCDVAVAQQTLSTASSSGSGNATRCSDSLKADYHPNADTKVTLVHLFRAGEDIHLGDKPSGHKADHDVCVVKLLVGPGYPGPKDAPSTSEGIGIEVWLPANAAEWNSRVRVLGGGGFSGQPTEMSLTDLNATQEVIDVVNGGFVTSKQDTGHRSEMSSEITSGAFGMTPDGKLNTVLWSDFAERGVHQQAVQTKGLAAFYYGQPVKYSYWDGCSTGGRQGLVEAQRYPDDFDGLLIGAPAINWSKFVTSELYPQVVMQNDLSRLLTLDQLSLVSAAAVSACDSRLNGRHDGFITDMESCPYDPIKDKKVLCKSAGGLNVSKACLTRRDAKAMNKIWYGMTDDGRVANPKKSTGYGEVLDSHQLWFGLSRGTDASWLAYSEDGVGFPFSIATDQVALETERPALADPTFKNATGNGQDGWRKLNYADLAKAYAQGLEKQSQMGHINTDNSDLSAFFARGGKIIQYHGVNDQLIPSQGSNNYYARVAKTAGGYEKVRAFHRYYQIPAMGHCSGIGAVNGIDGTSPPANPPLPAPNQLFAVLETWVEKGVAPNEIVLSNDKMSRPVCPYPEKLAYTGGDPDVASSYSCVVRSKRTS
ncbi:tannase/feruloyl esterase family alpha/beta hydrolase [Asticcacaulis benevestitus]|uniref:Feruloyl esterase n=1 Tax=Asticcacaulis benevestitus DSM 16100 = ATCC BAA-896 TaxID=1121022 RepID=V4P912_9CAUL|nr:tannase/feruloyl esterase family alpha/beta hydrolase [Asticcacaulis benevestitus]ESQ81735.1 hypothetical protein ABENE_21585 [Asticcacaulis benevestitus DSM 16100 = ATCC BAA-896]